MKVFSGVTWWAAAGLMGVLLAFPVRGAVYTLKNGMQVEGMPGKIASLGSDVINSNGGQGDSSPKLILFADDGMRRTFFSTYQLHSAVPSPQANIEKIEIRQRVATTGRRIGSIGAILRVTPFDHFGRRIFTIKSVRGPIDILQGITEITPTYTKVQGLIAKDSFVCETRIATSSIPVAILSQVLKRQLDMNKPGDRLRIVRLYMQGQRYQDALAELEAAIEKFPGLSNLNDQVKQLRQRLAERLIREIEFRREAGQHEQVYVWLSNFPNQGVAVETLLLVRDMLKEYETQEKQRQEVLMLFEYHLAQIADANIKKKMVPILEEMKLELNLNTLDRMADFLRLADDQNLSSDAKLALAISGWLMGAGQGTENLAVAVSLRTVRDEVRNYLASEIEADRQVVLERLRTMEGSAPANVSRLISHMKPVKKTLPQETAIPGLMELEVPGLKEDEPFRYLVQLPPGYDPYRRYRCIVTLNGAGTTARQQIDWWAGAFHPQRKVRMGQATRHGCIVIAPIWNRAYQSKYMYSAREHAAVLFSLRDACQRFSIDTDRVFLSGHSMGGDAAWDIGLSHPDLWAGVIPVVARADKYVSRYWENGRNMSFYFVLGEMDGNSLANNSRDFNRYLTRQGFDTMIVEYRGRGHEHFQDEIHRMFEWIRLHERDFFPDEFKSVTMRLWDNYFWWAELDDFPKRSVVAPLEWPVSRARPAETEGTISENNRIRIRSGTAKVTVWLSPEMVDFRERIYVTINGREMGRQVEPSLDVLLEDVRTRGDRQHPFWAKVGL